jgi:hypothetical protein
MHPKAAIQPFIGTGIEVTTAINFQVYLCIVCTVWNEFRGPYSTVFKELFMLGFLYSLSRVLARISR